MKKKILFINHSGVYGGATRSLILYLNELINIHDIKCLSPKGSATNNFKNNNISFFQVWGLPQFNNCLIGYYKNFRWLILFREFFYLVYFFFWLLFNFKKISQFDIFHLNDVTLLPTGLLIKFFFSKKLIVHVRSKQKENICIAKKLVNFFLKNYADQIICIDKDVKKTIYFDDIKDKISIIYNSYIPSKLNRKSRIAKRFNVGFIGNFVFSKGLDILFEVVKINKNNNELNFFFAGPLQKNNFIHKVYNFFGLRAYYNNQIRVLKNYSNVHFLGFLNDLNEFYSVIDLICFPSYLEAAGRPTIEGFSHGIPTLLALKKEALNDYVIDNYNGFIFETGSVIDLNLKIEKISRNTNLNQDIKKNCFVTFEKKFSFEKNFKLFLKIF